MYSEDLQQVLGLLGQMEEREAMVLRLRFGLNGNAPCTLGEIGERLGIYIWMALTLMLVGVLLVTAREPILRLLAGFRRTST